MTEFTPIPWLRNGHAMTVYAWARSREFPLLPPAEDRLFIVAPDAGVLARCHWQPRRVAHPTLLLLHGLEGSANAHYMRGLADKALRAGFNVVRLNQRNCGRTEHLSTGLYHSGLTADPAAVVRELIERDQLPAFVLAGYSLGGNLALKLAGEFGEAAPHELKAVAAVSPTMDLTGSVTALERWSNRFYELNFLRSLKRRMRRKASLFPDRYDLTGLRRIRSIRAFDERYTAPDAGYRDAADYYHRASALRVVDRIRLPTLVLTAEDDPFIPVGPFRDGVMADNPAITVAITRHGGHCGFVAAPRGDDDGYWAESTVVEFAQAHRAPGRAAAGGAALRPARRV